MKKRIETRSQPFSELCISFTTSISILLIGIAALFFFWSPSETVDWMIYEFFSIFFFFFFFVLNFIFQKYPRLLRVYPIILMFNLAVVYSFVLFLYEKNEIGIRHLFFICLSVVPAVIQLFITVKNRTIRAFIGEIIKGKVFFETLLINNISVIAILAYFFVNFDRYSASTIRLLFCIVVIFLTGAFFVSTLKLQRIHASKVSAVLYFMLFVPIIFYICQVPIEYHHYSFYVGPIFDVIHGKSILLETPSQYGYLSIHFLAFFMRKTGVTFNMFNLINILLFSTYYIFSSILFLKILKNVVYASICTLIFATMQTFFSHYTYVLLPSTGPLRFGLGMIVFGVLVLLPKKFQMIASSFFASVSLFWSPETAIYVVPAWFFTCFAFYWNSTITLRRRWISLFRSVMLFCLFVLLFLGSIFFYEYANNHEFPKIGTFFEFATAYRVNTGSIPVPLYENYYLAIVIGLLGLAVVAHFMVKKIKSMLFPALSFLSIHNIAILSYYIGRSHENNIVNISGFLLLEVVTIFMMLKEQYLLQYIKIKHIVLIPIILFLVFYFVRVIDQFPPRDEYLSGILKPNIMGWVHSQKGPTRLRTMLFEEKLENSPVVLLDEEKDTLLLVESDIKNELPLNPAIMTTVLPNWKSKYVEPAIHSLAIGTVVVVNANDSNSLLLLKEIEDDFYLREVRRDTTFFISQIVSKKN